MLLQVIKRQQVVLTKKMDSLGAEGELVSVRNGYFRNYLLPQGFAKLADEGILAAIKAKREAEEAAARKVLDEAKALANALGMIGKFIVKKTVGEDKRIFGSVTEAEVANAIKLQTNQVRLLASLSSIILRFHCYLHTVALNYFSNPPTLPLSVRSPPPPSLSPVSSSPKAFVPIIHCAQDIDKRNLTLPEIKELGTYTATLKLHPEVTASFQVVVTK